MPQNWKTYKLGEICTDISYGYTESASKEEIGPKFLRITDIQNDFISWDDVPYCKISDKDLVKYQLAIGDVVVARTGNSTGTTAVIKQNINAVYASYLIRYRTDLNICDPMYLDFILRSKKWSDYVDAIKGGSAQPGANAKQFAEFEFNLPPLPEQRAIASILSSLDDKIELNLQMNKTLEDMAMTLYKHWFVDFGPFKDGTFIDSELGLIPERWEVKRLDQEFSITIGRTPPRQENEWFSKESGVKWISIKDMGQSGVYIFNTSEYLTNEAVMAKNVPIIPRDTVILSFKLTVGRVSITTETMVSNEAIAHFIKGATTTMTSEFLYLALKCFDYNSLGSTSSIATAVNSKTVKSISVIVPTREIMNLFQVEVQSLFEMIKNNSNEIESLTSLRETLLSKLISGEVRVKDAEQTIAEVL